MDFILDESVMFDSMIWSIALVGTGNSEYQNRFYNKQADKLRRRYEYHFTS